MNYFLVRRRVALLGIAALLGLSLLAAAFVLTFSQAAARQTPHAIHNSSPLNGSLRRYQGDGSVPSWDIMTYYVTVRCFS